MIYGGLGAFRAGGVEAKLGYGIWLVKNRRTGKTILCILPGEAAGNMTSYHPALRTGTNDFGDRVRQKKATSGVASGSNKMQMFKAADAFQIPAHDGRKAPRSESEHGAPANTYLVGEVAMVL